MTKLPVYEVRLRKVKTLNLNFELWPIDSTRTASRMAARIINQYLKGADREHFVVIMLNTKYEIIGINTVSIGTLDASLVHPREVFKPAILTNAAAIILAHNHPSGHPEPSEDDIKVTRKLKEAGEILGIDVLDHIIIGGPNNWYSMYENGKI